MINIHNLFKHRKSGNLGTVSLIYSLSCQKIKYDYNIAICMPFGWVFYGLYEQFY